MHDPYTPPSSDVSQPPDSSVGSLGRALLTSLGMGLVALGMSWFLFPNIFLRVFSPNSSFWEYRPSGPGLVVDIVFTALSFFGCSYVAARLNRPRPYLAAMGVGALGWLVYFWEVGGVSGIRFSEYPLWYELAPVDIVPAWIAGYVVSRTRR